MEYHGVADTLKEPYICLCKPLLHGTALSAVTWSLVLGSPKSQPLEQCNHSGKDVDVIIRLASSTEHVTHGHVTKRASGSSSIVTSVRRLFTAAAILWTV